MAKPLRLIIDFLTYDSSSAAPSNNPQDAIEIKRKVEEASVSEVSRVQKSIPASTVDMALNLVDSSNDYIIIQVDQIVSIKLNGSSDAIVLKPKVAGYKTPAFLLRGTATALTISNAGTNAANIDFVSVKI